MPKSMYNSNSPRSTEYKTFITYQITTSGVWELEPCMTAFITSFQSKLRNNGLKIWKPVRARSKNYKEQLKDDSNDD